MSTSIGCIEIYEEKMRNLILMSKCILYLGIALIFFIKDANALDNSVIGGASPIESRAKKGVCDDVARLLKPVPGAQKLPLDVLSEDLGGRRWRYKGVDIDKDGKEDDVIESCGSPSDGTCVLDVRTSSGSEYSFDDSYFFLIKYKKDFYVVIGYHGENLVDRRSLKKLGVFGVLNVCNRL